MKNWQIILEKNSPLLEKRDLDYQACLKDERLVKARGAYQSDLAGLIKQEFNAGRTAIYHPVNDIKAVFFDMDSTVIKQECIVELAKATGSSQKVSEITERAMAGELDFNEAFKERVKLLKGADETVIDEVISCLELNPGIEDFCQKARDLGIKLFLVSGGFIPMAEFIAKKLGFEDSHSNPLEVSNGQLSGEVNKTIINGDAKRLYVEDQMLSNTWTKDQILVVGDGANDLAMMSLSEVSIGFKAKPSLYDHISGLNTQNHLSLIDVVGN